MPVLTKEYSLIPYCKENYVAGGRFVAVYAIRTYIVSYTVVLKVIVIDCCCNMEVITRWMCTLKCKSYTSTQNALWGQ